MLYLFWPRRFLEHYFSIRLKEGKAIAFFILWHAWKMQAKRYPRKQQRQKYQPPLLWLAKKAGFYCLTWYLSLCWEYIMLFMSWWLLHVRGLAWSCQTAYVLVLTVSPNFYARTIPSSLLLYEMRCKPLPSWSIWAWRYRVPPEDRKEPSWANTKSIPPRTTMAPMWYTTIFSSSQPPVINKAIVTLQQVK